MRNLEPVIKISDKNPNSSKFRIFKFCCSVGLNQCLEEFFKAKPEVTLRRSVGNVESITLTLSNKQSILWFMGLNVSVFTKLLYLVSVTPYQSVVEAGICIKTIVNIGSNTLMLGNKQPILRCMNLNVSVFTELLCSVSVTHYRSVVEASVYTKTIGKLWFENAYIRHRTADFKKHGGLIVSVLCSIPVIHDRPAMYIESISIKTPKFTASVYLDF